MIDLFTAEEMSCIVKALEQGCPDNVLKYEHETALAKARAAEAVLQARWNLRNAGEQLKKAMRIS